MILQIIDQNEDRPRGTYEFPFEFHHIDQQPSQICDVLPLACGI